LRDAYIVPGLGKHELRELRPQVIQRFAADLDAQGVGQETIRKTLVLLQGVLERVVEWGRLQANPVKVVRKPRQGRKRLPRALLPMTVEQLRKRLHPRDAALVSVLAYAGLRPGEALALTWANIGEQIIVVQRAAALGEEKETKTRHNRSVRLLKPLASDLAEWRMASGRPDQEQLVFRCGTADFGLKARTVIGAERFSGLPPRRSASKIRARTISATALRPSYFRRG
jgi:integrase